MISNFINEKKIDRTPIRYKNIINYLEKENTDILEHKIFSSKVFEEGRLKKKTLFYIVFNLQPTTSSIFYTLLLVYKERGIPYIYVVSPNLNSINNDKSKIPHLYDYKRFRLCLYYPYYDEYKQNDYIAEQVIPWTKLWLFHYELWLCTKEWFGGGIHPGDDEDIEVRGKLPKKKFGEQSKKKMKNINEFESIANNIYIKVKKALNEAA